MVRVWEDTGGSFVSQALRGVGETDELWAFCRVEWGGVPQRAPPRPTHIHLKELSIPPTHIYTQRFYHS